MKIGQSLFQFNVPKQDTKEPTTSMSFTEQFEKTQQALKEAGQKFVAELQEARTDMGEDDPKVQRLIEKFKNGKKLTPEEMTYIRKNAPGMVETIERIMREREMIELSMKIAPTKTDVQLAVFRASKQIEKHPDPEQREIRAKHLADAKHEYEQTEEYKEKPNSPLEKNERKSSIVIKPSKKSPSYFAYNDDTKKHRLQNDTQIDLKR